MNSLVLLLPLLAVLPLAAQADQPGQAWEVTVFEGRQTFQSASSQNGDLGFVESYSTPKRYVTALRAGWIAMDWDLVSLQITGAYQPMMAATQTSYLLQGYPTTAYQSYDYKAGYTALGAMARIKLLVDVAVGVDYRFEQLSALGYSTSYNRPWARATVGWEFTRAKISPIVGAEAAYPLSTKSLQLLGDTDNSLQSTAPKSQLGVYAGVRF